MQRCSSDVQLGEERDLWYGWITSEFLISNKLDVDFRGLGDCSPAASVYTSGDRRLAAAIGAAVSAFLLLRPYS